MKQVLIGIFAHPDDESFGPSATLLKLTDEGVDVHLIVVTNGENGVNEMGHTDLGAVRLTEWHTATSLIGAVSSAALGYSDSGLSHGQYDIIEAKLLEKTTEIAASYLEPIELSFMTFDQNGITGHLDHIAVSYLTTNLFFTLKKQPLEQVSINELWYYCLSEAQAPEKDWSSFFTPIGREDAFINRKIEVREWLPKKYAVMDAHTSQHADAEFIKNMGDELLATDHFHIIN